jgi:hypothetical protein
MPRRAAGDQPNLLIEPITPRQEAVQHSAPWAAACAIDARSLSTSCSELLARSTVFHETVACRRN